MVSTLDWIWERLPYAMLVLDAQHYVLKSNEEARKAFGQQADPGSHFAQHYPSGQHRLPSPEAGALGWVLEVVHGENGQWLYVFREEAQVSWTSADTEQLAFEDPLTGLPNWNILSQFVEHSCSQSQRYLRSSALLKVDLDHLRQVNADYGRSSGDEVLIQAAQRLQNHVRSSDIVGRLEADQFLIILTELSNERAAAHGQSTILHVRARAAVVAERLVKAFRQPFQVADTQLHCPISVGVAICPEDARLPQEWILAADLALGQSKESGGDCHSLYAEALKQRFEERQDLHKRLETAFKKNEVRFDWLPVLGPEALEYYWWRWPEANLQGPEVRDWLESGGLQAAWARWQKDNIKTDGAAKVVPLPPSWLGPSFDANLLLDSSNLWEVNEALLFNPQRMQSLVHLQERGLQWVLACSARGLQNLSSLGKLTPRILNIRLPNRVSFEQERLLLATAQVAECLSIELLVSLPAAAAQSPLAARLKATWMMQLPG
jgi:diguanylate cyclase (GGDEF)-like protein